MKYDNRSKPSSCLRKDLYRSKITGLGLSCILAGFLSACSGGTAPEESSKTAALPPLGAAYAESLGLLQSSGPVQVGPDAQAQAELTQDAYYAATLDALLDSTSDNTVQTGSILFPQAGPSAVVTTPTAPTASTAVDPAPIVITVTEPAAGTTPTAAPVSNFGPGAVANPNTTLVTSSDTGTTAAPVAAEAAAGDIPVSALNTVPVGVRNVAPQKADGSYESYSTPGFVGRVTAGGTIDLQWPSNATAKGYNIFRDSEYVLSVAGTQWTDTDTASAKSYYYEVEAYDVNNQFTRVGEGLTVWIDPAAASVNPPLPPPVQAGYDLVFAEEFRGSTVDFSTWRTSHLWGPDVPTNSEVQYYVDTKNEPDWGFNPFKFDGELLTINATRTPENLLDKANGQQYLSGILTTYDSFRFTYGYVETRAKVPRGQGYWPAFWLLNAYYVDIEPEIDIIEHIGQDVDVIYHTYHYYEGGENLRSTPSQGSKGIDFTAGFHNYGVEWKPGTIIYYIDGVEKHRITDRQVSSQEMYIIINVALGGWWAGPPDQSTPFPGEYQIDYIRAYQKRGPQDDFPLDDGIDKIPYADDNEKRSPNHKPSFEQFPQGYPAR